jgi:pimeloyl-ACP methyl ester carboxylesterase
MPKHIIIFSHGFGVRKDDRGLLTDIASAFPEAECVFFDYFEVDEEKKTLMIRPLSVQAKMLNEVVQQARTSNPEATIDLICHSQGTMVAALAKPDGIRKTILLAPAFDMSLERSLKRYSAYVNLNGISELPPVDGLTRVVPPEYWAERKDMKALEEYNKFSEKTELIAIEANQDQLLPKVDLTDLSPKVKLAPLDGNHGFAGEAREPLKARLKELLS